MSDRNREFELPGLPPGCLKCGHVRPVTLQKVEYKCNSTNALSLVTVFLGFLLYTETTYTLHLPLCESCAANRKRKWIALLLMLPVVGGLFVPAFEYGLTNPEFFALPVIAALGLLIASAVFQARATPKAVRVTKELLVIDVPGHGHVALVGEDPAPRRQAPPRPRREDAGPRLNRSVCDGCGFINFPNVAECKKCHAPLGRAEAV